MCLKVLVYIQVSKYFEVAHYNNSMSKILINNFVIINVKYYTFGDYIRLTMTMISNVMYLLFSLIYYEVIYRNFDKIIKVN